MGGLPGYFQPYFDAAPYVSDEAGDYADPRAVLKNTRTYEWLHTVSDLLTALFSAGLQLEWFHEHDRVPWRMFRALEADREGMYRWPDKSWLPLALSLSARKPR